MEGCRAPNPFQRGGEDIPGPFPTLLGLHPTRISAPPRAAAPEPSLALVLALILALILVQHHRELRLSGEFGVNLECPCEALGCQEPYLGTPSPIWGCFVPH